MYVEYDDEDVSRMVHAVVHAVLKEQARQIARGENNPEALAAVYRRSADIFRYGGK